MHSASDPLTHAQRAAMGVTDGDQARAGQAVAQAAPNASDHRPRITEPSHALALLTWAAGFDGRERGRFEADAWFAALEGVVIEDARAAITEHYRRSRYPVMPADVVDHLEGGEQ